MAASEIASAPRARDGSIDLLRALLFIYVVAYLHLGGYIADGQRHVHWSTVAVTNIVLGTFTFLSGYVLGQWKGRAGRTELADFYIRRLLRIYPLYLLALAGFVVMWLADPLTAAKAAIGISMFWPQPPMTLWFVTMIIVCYLLAPAIIIPGPRRGLLAAGGLWVAMLSWNFVVHEIDPRMLTQFAAFTAGIALRRFGLRSPARLHLPALSLAFGLSLACAISTLHLPLLGAVAAVPSVVLGPALLLALADCGPGIKFGTRRVIAFLSYVSFSAYLFHRIVFELVRRVVWPTSEWAQLGVLLAIGLPAVLAASAIVQVVYDHLLTRLQDSDSLWRPRSAADTSSR